MKFTVRPTTEEDWEYLKDVRLASLIDTPTAFGVTHATAKTYSDAQWRDRAAGRGQAQFILAFVDDACIGIVGHVLSPNLELNLIAMWVRPGYRGRGVAEVLGNSVIEHAVADRHARVVLDVAPDNVRAASLYRKLGFSFLQEWDALESHPCIKVQKMEWLQGN